MRTATLIRLAVVNSVGFSGSTIMPLWLGGIAGYFHQPAWFAGLAVAAQMGGAALFNLAAPLLFARTAPLALARGALLVAAGGNLLAAAPSPLLFLAGCLLCGCALGVVLNVTNRLMGSDEHVQKGYAIFLIVEVCIATAMVLASSHLAGVFGLPAMFGLAACAAFFAFVVLGGVDGVPGANSSLAAGPRVPAGGRRHAVLALAAFGLFFIGQATINSFMPSIGLAAGLTPVGAGELIGLGMPFGLLGAVLARLSGERVPASIPVAAVVVIVSILAIALTRAPGTPLFLGTVVTLAVGTMFAVPYFFARLGALDHAGRYAALGPAMMLIGLAAGPSAAVLIEAHLGLASVGRFSGIFLLASGLLFLLSAPKRRRSSADPLTA